MPNYLSPGVYVEELEAAARPIEGVGTAVAAFVGLTSDGPFHEPTLVTNWAQFVKNFGDPLPGSYLGHAVYGYFLNGGGQAYVVRVGGPAAGEASPRPMAELTSAEGSKPAYTATALEEGAPVTVEITQPSEGSPEDTFRVVIRSGEREEVFDQVSSKRGRTNVVSVVNAASQIVRLEETRGQVPDRRPGMGTVQLTSPLPQSVVPRPADYVGDSADRTGFGGLEAIEGITMVMPSMASRPFRRR